MYPYPHRINNIPLLDENGALNEIYVEDIPYGMNPDEYINNILYQPPFPISPQSNNILSSNKNKEMQIKFNETISVMHSNDSDSSSDSVHTTTNLF